MPKTPPYQQKADKASRDRKKKAGYVYYVRMVKREWKDKLDTLLRQLKNDKILDLTKNDKPGN